MRTSAAYTGGSARHDCRRRRCENLLVASRFGERSFLASSPIWRSSLQLPEQHEVAIAAIGVSVTIDNRLDVALRGACRADSSGGSSHPIDVSAANRRCHADGQVAVPYRGTALNSSPH